MATDPFFPRQQLTQFAEQRVAGRTTLFELKSIYGLSALRDVTKVAGSGTVTNTIGDGEYKLSTTANGTDRAELESAEIGRYVPGSEMEIGIGVRIPVNPTSDQVFRWGYFDDDDGVFFGLDATGLFLGVRNLGSDTIIRPSEWNGDTVDGTGLTRLSLDLSRGNIFMIDFSWYGYGSIEWSVLIPDATNQQQRLPLHYFSPQAQISFNNPNLPIRVENDNNGTATARDIFVTGRRCGIIGDYRPYRRLNTEHRLELNPVGDVFLPLVSIRRKTNFLRVSVKIDGLDIITDKSILVEMRTGTSLTGASFVTPTGTTAAETALEADNSATALSGGEQLHRELISGGAPSGKILNRDRGLSFDLSGTDIVTLAVRKLPSETNATVSALLRFSEEW